VTPSFPRHIQGAVLRIPPLVSCTLTPTGLSPSMARRSRRVRLRVRGIGGGPTTPHPQWVSPPGSVCPLPFSLAGTQGIAICFLFLPLLRCFRSGRSRSLPGATGVYPRQEVPFGHPRFYGCMRLAGAFRSLPRPSSAPEPSHPLGGFFDPHACATSSAELAIGLSMQIYFACRIAN